MYDRPASLRRRLKSCIGLTALRRQMNLDYSRATPGTSSNTSGALMRIAYLVNTYPKVSHSFIRREILALERRNVDVVRIALRGWDEELADDEDSLERERTRFVLQDGAAGLLIAVVDAARTAGSPDADGVACVEDGPPRRTSIICALGSMWPRPAGL
jgi:hypothetical protein